ncbi:MAG: hypothetical protein R6W70_09120 [bacterium]
MTRSSKKSGMNQIILALFVSVFGGALIWFVTNKQLQKETSERRKEDTPLSFSGNLESLTAGVPEGSEIDEVRTAFLPREKVSVEGLWRIQPDDYEADFIWMGPDRKVKYETKMSMKKNWTRTHVHYRGPEPMKTGKWHVLVRRDEKTLGGISYEVVETPEEIPIKQQVKTFEREKVSPGEAAFITETLISTVKGRQIEADYIDDKLEKKEAELIVRFFNRGKKLGKFKGKNGNIRSSLKNILKKIDVKEPFSHLELSIIYRNFEIPVNTYIPRFKIYENKGFALNVGDKKSMLLPSVIWKKNINDGDSLLQQLSVDAGLPEAGWKQKGAKLYNFFVDQYVSDAENDEFAKLYFGKTPLREISLADIKETIDLAVDWYIENQHENGRFMYTYYPDREKEPEEGWCLRDLNAQYVLSEIAVERKHAELLKSVRKNLEMYKNALVTENGRLFLHWKKHLADSSIASTSFLMTTMLILDDDMNTAKKLAESIMDLQGENGRFKTDFVKKTDSETNQLYYPGETLLALSYYYDKTKDKRVLEVAEKAYEFYTDFFHNKKSDPFVPWQARAYKRFYEITGERKYASFVFRMMDWLLDSYPPLENSMPGKEGALKLRFASTGVYTEGLAEAYELAVSLNDRNRIKRYGKALKGAAKYLTNLQYKEIDAYQFRKPDKIVGAMTMKPFDNETRLDATYHAVGALHIIDRFMNDREFEKLGK